MSVLLEQKTCLVCNRPIKGRVDKKYCDDSCRNNYNNQQKAKGSHSPYVRNINNALLKNRRILAAVLGPGDDTVKVSKDRLLQDGFRFSYTTHTYTTRMGKTYFFCYDYGYLPLDSEWFLIVKKKSE